MSLSYKNNVSSLSETRAKAIDIVSAEVQEESQRLLGHDVASVVYHTFLDYTVCSDVGGKKEDSIAQPAHLDAWIATVETCLKEQYKARRLSTTDVSRYIRLLPTAAIRQLGRRVGLFL